MGTKEKLKQNKAITLVALIITIVILLILAGITIEQINNNGLFKNTKIASEKYKNSRKDENVTIDDYSNQIENYEVSGNGRDMVTISKEEYENLKNINRYSTNETRIGTYVDETPIYQKTIIIENDKKSTIYNHCKAIETDTDNVKEILNSWGYYTVTDRWGTRKNNFNISGKSSDNENADLGRPFLKDNKVYLNFTLYETSFSISNINITIQYMKCE